VSDSVEVDVRFFGEAAPRGAQSTDMTVPYDDAGVRISLLRTRANLEHWLTYFVVRDIYLEILQT
jgi:hypothetical protein